ncbi:Ribonuclease BN, tRNA processing enzyme [Corynebacterium mycetoides]|uniref:Ribonuclease BN, tRNA processing enzyme n=1 Tax=Corynebacterium mycetoides TaxID=38302 RepID=A0A1G9NVB3_9CORY|nr:MBL fold metallo-hydrolase [Corynebacterium mycetoides]SDL90253.1 Ribonuclease BN, tRNA processing enzyme [Corynebacterium mycetoides]
MKLTILGCSGSLSAPGNPGSSYLITVPDRPGILMDCGPGALAALQEVSDPSDTHVIFSHLHADHCSDAASLLVWRRYHPTAPSSRRHFMFGPSHTALHIGRMGADGPDEVDDITDTFDFRPWESNRPVDIEGLTVTPVPVDHTAKESHALRVEDPAGAVIAFSGDSGMTDTLVDAARDADIFLCEAAWGPSHDGKPDGMHLSGAQAGEIARRAGVRTLVLVHIQPWADKEATLNAARSEFDGEILLGAAGDVFDL